MLRQVSVSSACGSTEAAWAISNAFAITVRFALAWHIERARGAVRCTPLGQNDEQKCRSASRAALPALGEGDGGFQGLAVAEHSDGDDVTDFAAAQRVCEVVEIVNGLLGEIDEHVAGFEARLGGGRAGLNVAEAHAVFRLAEVGNRSEPGAVAATSAGICDTAVGIFGRDSDEFG